MTFLVQNACRLRIFPKDYAKGKDLRYVNIQKGQYRRDKHSRSEKPVRTCRLKTANIHVLGLHASQQTPQERIWSAFLPCNCTKSISLTELKQAAYFLLSGKPTFCSLPSPEVTSERKVPRGGQASARVLAPDGVSAPVTLSQAAQAPAYPTPAPLRRKSPFSITLCLAGHAGLILVLLSSLLLPRIYEFFSPAVPIFFPTPVKTTSAGIHGLSVG